MAPKRTESVERAMAILSAFSSQRPRMKLSELARETGLHKSTVLRITNSMAIYGFIQRDDRGWFGIGPSAWRLGQLFRRDYLSREFVAPALRELVVATGETASFYVRSGEDRVCLYRENAPNLSRFHAEEGMRLRLSTGASGLVLRRFSGEAVEDPDAFTPRGTAFSHGTTIPEISAVATPVFSRTGTLRGALTVSGLGSRFDDAAQRRIVPLLERLATSLAT